MIEAVHRYEGTVNRVLGDGIMALFGAPIAHEDHAVRFLLRGTAHAGDRDPLRRRDAALPWRPGTDPRRAQCREVVVRAIDSSLHMDYGGGPDPPTWRHAWSRWPSRARCSPQGRPCNWPKGSCRSKRWAQSRSRGWRTLWRCSSWSVQRYPDAFAGVCGAGAHPVRRAAGGV